MTAPDAVVEAVARASDAALCKTLIRRVNRARRFPVNTCAASRHVQMIAEALAKKQPYLMLQEEPEHCAISMLATVAALFEARNEIAKLAAAYQHATRER